MPPPPVRLPIRLFALSLLLLGIGGGFVPSAQADDPLTELLAPAAADEEAADEVPSEGGGSIDTAGSALDDAAIRERLRGIYGALDALDRLEVAVDSGIVTLGGTADSAAAAERAVEIATQVDGVVEVIDESVVDTDVGRRLRATLERLQDGTLSLLTALPVFLVALAVVALFWWLGRRVGARRGLFRSIAPNGFIAELLGGLARIVVVLLGLFLALSLLDATSIIGTVLGAAGIVGLAVGFAVRDTVENYIASILLSLRTPFLARDYVRIGEHEGSVARLTSRATVLISLDGNHIRIPNSVVFKATIVNYTRNPARRISFFVGVDTDLDLEEAQRVALETVRGVRGVLHDPPPLVVVSELGDSNVSLEVLIWFDQRESDLLKVRGAATRRVKQAFDEAGIVMPEPIYRVKVGPAALDALDGRFDDGDGTRAAAPSAGGEAPASMKGEDAARSDPDGRARGSRDRRRGDPGSAGREADRGSDPADTSVDRSIAVTLEREIENPGAENLLDGEPPRE